jgi:hypothetical protein
MRDGVVLAGAVVVILRRGLMRGESLKPHFVVMQEPAFIIIYEVLGLGMTRETRTGAGFA